VVVKPQPFVFLIYLPNQLLEQPKEQVEEIKVLQFFNGLGFAGRWRVLQVVLRGVEQTKN